jgi:hypothetical protein
MIDRLWLLGRTFICPGRGEPIDLFAPLQGPLDNASPERSSLPGRPGVRPAGLHRNRHLLAPTKRVRDRFR